MVMIESIYPPYIICNGCEHLSFTETEQNDLKAKGIYKDHRCLKYDQRVFHHTNDISHDETLYACEECVQQAIKDMENCDKYHSYIRYFARMQEEYQKEPLNRFQIEDLQWHLCKAIKIDKLFTMKQLKDMFPDLLV